jgi:hypothetical protein
VQITSKTARRLYGRFCNGNIEIGILNTCYYISVPNAERMQRTNDTMSDASERKKENKGTHVHFYIVILYCFIALFCLEITLTFVRDLHVNRAAYSSYFNKLISPVASFFPDTMTAVSSVRPSVLSQCLPCLLVSRCWLPYNPCCSL